MAILKIARMGHSVLKQAANVVDDPTDPAIRRLVDDMIATMKDAPGIGLAAPQVHVPLRVVIFTVPPARADDGDAPALSATGPVPLTVLVNPVIEPLGPETAFDLESCLSVPGLAGLVPRYTRIRYRGVGLDGRIIERTAEGFHARVVQHECDHLDGVLYPQRMVDLKTLGFVEEVRRFPPDLAVEGASGREVAA